MNCLDNVSKTDDFQQPVHTHVIGLVFLLCAYLGWASFGKLFIGRAPYFWLDPEFVHHRELMFGYCALFVALGPACKSHLDLQLVNKSFITDRSCFHSFCIHVRPHWSARRAGREIRQPKSS